MVILDRLNLTQKALAPLLLMALAFAATVAVGVSALERTTSAYRRIVDQADPAVLRLAGLTRMTDLVGYSIDRNLVYRCLGADAADCARTDHDLRFAVAQGAALLDDAERIDPDHRADYEHFRGEFRAIAVPTQLAMTFGIADQNDQAKAVMTPVNDRILALADELTRYTNTRSAADQKQALALADGAVRTEETMVGEGILAALMGVGVAAWIAFFEVTAPLARLGQSMARLAGGNLGAEVEGEGRRDEIGAMARAVQVFKQNATARLRAEAEAAEAREAVAQAKHDAQAELARVARALSVGELASQIAHEINQPIAGVVTNSEASLRWLARATPNIDRARQATERSIHDAQRASAVIGRVRNMLAKGAPQFADVDINAVIEAVLESSLDDRRRAQVTVRTRLAADLPRVHGDAIQLQQVLLNLVMNAVDAMSAVKGRPRLLSLRTQVTDHLQVQVTVEDRGGGIDPEVAERLFEPFVTSKTGGIGLGLPISRSIIESHGGQIWAEAAAEQGAVFQFRLPAAQRQGP
ncbi:MAG TPA: ATP-binding protein [Caulobacteraceae bacterium]